VAPPDWPVGGPAFVKLAITPALFGVSILFWKERDDNPWHWTRNAAGILAAAAIAAITYACLFGDYEAFFTNPWALVGFVAMGGLATAAGNAWRWPLSIPAMAAMVSIVARHVHTDLPDRLTGWSSQAVDWARSAQIWPIIVMTAIWLLFCLWERPGRQSTLTGLLVVVLAGIIAREVWMLAGVGAGK
jgi:branched-subunit amino acid transport protein